MPRKSIPSTEFAFSKNKYVGGSLSCIAPVLTSPRSAQLRSQLNETRHYNSASASPPQHYVAVHQRFASDASITPSSSARSPPGGSPNGQVAVMHPTLEISTSVALDSPGSQVRGSTGSPEMLQPIARERLIRHSPVVLVRQDIRQWDRRKKRW